MIRKVLLCACVLTLFGVSAHAQEYAISMSYEGQGGWAQANTSDGARQAAVQACAKDTFGYNDKRTCGDRVASASKQGFVVGAYCRVEIHGGTQFRFGVAGASERSLARARADAKKTFLAAVDAFLARIRAQGGPHVTYTFLRCEDRLSVRRGEVYR